MKNRTMIIVVGVVVLVIGLAGAAMMLSGGDNANSDGVPAASETPRETYGENVEQNRPVEVTGDPLPGLDTAAEVDPAIGTAMPVIVGAGFDGRPITVGGPTDGPTMYVFLAHWCPHCNDEIPELIDLKNRDGIPQGLNVVGISTAVDEGAPNYPPSDWIVNKDWPSQWPVMADSAESMSFIVNGGSEFPYLMIVDSDGKVLERASGTKSADDLASWITATLESGTA